MKRSKNITIFDDRTDLDTIHTPEFETFVIKPMSKDWKITKNDLPLYAYSGNKLGVSIEEKQNGTMTIELFLYNEKEKKSKIVEEYEDIRAALSCLISEYDNAIILTDKDDFDKQLDNYFASTACP